MPLLSFATPQSRLTRAVLTVPAVALAVASVAGCGGGSTKAAATPTAAASAGTTTAAAAGAGAGGAAGGFAAYAACLKKNGVTLPTGRPGGAAGASGGARRSGGAGGFGGGFGGANATSGPFAAAEKACASVRPTGGFGGAAGGNNAALQSELTAYRSCLSDHGVTLPTQAARPTGAPAAGASPGARRAGGGFGGIGALNTADPKVAAAVKTCAPLRPTFTTGRAAGSSGNPVPAATPSS